VRKEFEQNENKNDKEFSLSEGSLLEKEKVLGSNPPPPSRTINKK